MKRCCTMWALWLSSLLAIGQAWAGGPFGIDHRVAVDDHGIWNRKVQKDFAIGSTLVVLGGAFAFDRDSRIGRTFDQSVDAFVIGDVGAVGMKYAFSRERPSQTSDPNRFFTGHGAQSFPSGEVTTISAMVTPFILEYHRDHPWVYALALLPAYDAVARVKVRGHWQSDVLAGAAIGFAAGVYAHHRKTPLVIGILPKHGLMIGYQKTF